jgi:hypothetical protein
LFDSILRESKYVNWDDVDSEGYEENDYEEAKKLQDFLEENEENIKKMSTRMDHGDIVEKLYSKAEKICNFYDTEIIGATIEDFVADILGPAESDEQYQEKLRGHQRYEEDAIKLGFLDGKEMADWSASYYDNLDRPNNPKKASRMGKKEVVTKEMMDDLRRREKQLWDSRK